MELQVAQVMNMLQVLQDISEEDLPFGLAYRLTGVIEELVLVQKRYNEQVKRLYDKYIEKDESGEFKTEWDSRKGEQILAIKNDSEEDFNQAGVDLLNERVQIPIEKLNIEDWEQANIEINLQEMMILKPLFA